MPALLARNAGTLGDKAELRENQEIRESYLGLNDAGTRRSYRDV